MSNRIDLVRLTIIRQDRVRGRREHFASAAEADLCEKIALNEGKLVVRHTISVPTEPDELAKWLNDYSAGA